jgi:hypothetical protein
VEKLGKFVWGKKKEKLVWWRNWGNLFGVKKGETCLVEKLGKLVWGKKRRNLFGG